MRHRKAGIKLNRTSSHRKAMFRNMVTSLIKHERIRTTHAKAKALRSWADHVVTLSKKGDLHARRQALAIMTEKNVVHKLFDEMAGHFKERNGGYTRIVKLERRPGDAAPMALVELVTSESSSKKKEKLFRKKEKAYIEPTVSETQKAEAESSSDTKPPAADEDITLAEIKGGEPSEKIDDKDTSNSGKVYATGEATPEVKTPVEGEIEGRSGQDEVQISSETVENETEVKDDSRQKPSSQEPTQSDKS